MPLGEKNTVLALNEKKVVHGFLYLKNMANFDVFHWNISSNINFLFLKSDSWTKLCSAIAKYVPTA